MVAAWALAAVACVCLGTVAAQTSFPTNAAVMHVDFSVSTGVTTDSGNIATIQMAQDTYNYASNRVRGRAGWVGRALGELAREKFGGRCPWPGETPRRQKGDGDWARSTA